MRKNSVAARMKLLSRLTSKKNNRHITKYIFAEDQPGSSWENYQPPVKRRMFDLDEPELVNPEPVKAPPTAQVHRVNVPGLGPKLVHNHNPNIKNPTLIFSDVPFSRSELNFDPEDLIGSLAWVGERLVYVSGFDYTSNKLVAGTRPDKRMTISPSSVMPFEDDTLVKIIDERGEAQSSYITRIKSTDNSPYQVADSSIKGKRYPIYLVRKFT